VTEGFGSADWTIVTVTFNSAEHLRTCWSSGPPGEATWLVVDNMSCDDTVTVARDLGAQVIEMDENVGFSTANNVGLRHVQTSWVAFVNPDVTVGKEGDLERLARVAEANQGFVAPQLLNVDGTEQRNARGLPYPLSKLAHRSLRLPGVDLSEYVRVGFDAPVYVAWVMGAALAGLTSDFREIDGWDERFFLYYEEHDIGLRAWRIGKPVVVDPSVRWVHRWQRATARMELAPWRHELRSARRFYRKYPQLLSRWRSGNSSMLGEVQQRLWKRAEDA
jgi:N-acetylglucosaminyl-diphospho-decaprenol L-rhamnosyltransferase